VLITGEVDRTTEFERGLPSHEAWRGGRWEPDPLILDEQPLVVHVRGRGLVVLTGCGHAGAVNIARHAMRLTGVDRLHALLGGFHLTGRAFEPVIEPTVAAFADMASDVLVPAHCTDWKAQHRLASALPNAFVPNAVGTSFTLAGSGPWGLASVPANGQPRCAGAPAATPRHDLRRETSVWPSQASRSLGMHVALPIIRRLIHNATSPAHTERPIAAPA
jgi:hypothetical protein